jgi:uncharacterized protein (DUF433 family)
MSAEWLALRPAQQTRNMAWMSTSPTAPWQYLEPKPGSTYRQLFVKGTRIAARTLYSYFVPGEDWPGMTAEEIADNFNLPAEAVREAIAYCQSAPPEIDADLAREEAIMEATGMNDPNYKYHPSPKLLSPEQRHRLTQP